MFSSVSSHAQSDTRVGASPHVQDEGTFWLGSDRGWHLRDSQLRLFGDFSRDRLLVHHRGEPRHEHERSQFAFGTVEHPRRCETQLLHHRAQTGLLFAFFVVVVVNGNF